MNRLTQFLDWLDNAAGGMIRLAYLAAGITAIAVYFGAGHLPSAIEDPLNAALPWALAFAVETHTYITARRVRAAWQEKSSGGMAALKVNLGILAFLLAFSAWNQLGYLAATWHPPVATLALPGWLSYVVRALVVPAAFMAAAFLAPLAEPITVQIEAEARATLADVFKIARKQRRRMLRDAERSGRDMTGALVELVGDPETRRIISHAYGAIGAPIAMAAPVIVDAPPAPSPEATDDKTRPPTGGGTPIQRRGVRTPDESGGKVVRLPRTHTPRRSAASNRSKPGTRRVRTASVEDRARAAWTGSGMSVDALQSAASISRGSAQKYHAKLTAEAAQQPAESQAAQ